MVLLSPPCSQEMTAIDTGHVSPLGRQAAAHDGNGCESVSKPRKTSSITPRSFKRFFTPISAYEKPHGQSTYKKVLKSMTPSALNAVKTGAHVPFPAKQLDSIYGAGTSQPVPTLSVSFDDHISHRHPTTPGAPLDQSPSLQSSDIPDKFGLSEGASDRNLSDLLDDPAQAVHGRKRRKHDALIVSLKRAQEAPASRTLSKDSFLRREVSGSNFHSISSRYQATEAASHRRMCQTSDFVSNPEDCFVMPTCQGREDPPLPFCSTACNTNSLVAIGGETGMVSLLDSDDKAQPFSRAYLHFRPHRNAIMDMHFSPDDMRLATASGDQTCQIVDMPTQKAIYGIDGHRSTIKQVRFQPGNAHIVATSSRDGNVGIWDLRCRDTRTTLRDLNTIWSDQSESLNGASDTVVQPQSFNFFLNAHTQPMPIDRRSHKDRTGRSDTARKLKQQNPTSVTTLQFLQAGREHLLLTGADTAAVVKLWDIRMHRRKSSTGPSKAVSVTTLPSTHVGRRSYGLTSMTLSTDAARLYTLCRDGVVYAYSTNHLLRGHAPQMAGSSRCSPLRWEEQIVPGPLYGLRHPQMQISTFYSKCSIRQARANHSEMLACGSNNGMPLVLPTDEAVLLSCSQEQAEGSHSFDRPRNPQVKTCWSHTPIFTAGTPLIRGHSKEVTATVWSHEGALITASDDGTVRCWRENQDEARRLRMNGEKDGGRWNSGWSQVPDSFDEDDG